MELLDDLVRRNNSGWGRLRLKDLASLLQARRSTEDCPVR